MGGSGSKPTEEIIITQQQQQQQLQQQQQQPAETGFGPVHVIAACMVVLIIGYLLRVVWRAIMKEIENRPRRSVSVATIV